MFPVDIIKQSWNKSIIPQAYLEPALLHVILGIASSTIASLRGESPLECSAVMQAHKTASISLINQRLQSISDAVRLSTIFTIVMLLGLEVSHLSKLFSRQDLIHMSDDH